MGKDLIIACDFASQEDCQGFLSLFQDKKPYIKIGMELFYGAGPDFVRLLRDQDYEIFLDLKLHDIPNTVKKTMKVIKSLGIAMTNVHVQGTMPMMMAALEGLEEGGGQSPALIGVTQLTSTSQEVMTRDLKIEEDIESYTLHLAKLAKKAGLQGVVCSPLEAPLIHKDCGEDFLTVTPGIRFRGDKAGDQARVTTPAQAKELGSDYIVMGRSITKAEDPVQAYRQARKDFLGE